MNTPSKPFKAPPLAPAMSPASVTVTRKSFLRDFSFSEKDLDAVSPSLRYRIGKVRYNEHLASGGSAELFGIKLAEMTREDLIVACAYALKLSQPSYRPSWYL